MNYGKKELSGSSDNRVLSVVYRKNPFATTMNLNVGMMVQQKNDATGFENINAIVIAAVVCVVVGCGVGSMVLVGLFLWRSKRNQYQNI